MKGILRRLMLSLRGRVPYLPLDLVGDDAIAKGRKRLGVEPVRCFFLDLGKAATAGERFHGFRVLAMDGVRLSMPDTPENTLAFGKATNKKGDAAFPQLLVVGLLCARTRELVDANITKYASSEISSGEVMLRSVTNGDLITIDRGFYSVPYLWNIRKREGHFLCRVQSGVKLKPLPGQEAAQLRGDYITEVSGRVPLAPGEPSPYPTAKTKHVKLRLRVIQYKTQDGELVRLVTDLLDHAITALEFVRLYHERWEFELANDEIKTHLSAAPAGTAPTILRSKTPENVMQEVYALLSTYNLIRRIMLEAAKTADEPLTPLNVSFVGTLRVLQQTIPIMASAPASQLPRLYRSFLQDVLACEIDRPRRRRRYPRVVKQPVRSKFPRKKQGDGPYPAFLPEEAILAEAAS
jgi:hypothetical protein